MNMNRRDRKVIIVGSLAILVAIITYGLLSSTGTFTNDIWNLSGAIVGFLAALYGLNKVYGEAEDDEKLSTTVGASNSHTEGSIIEFDDHNSAVKKIKELLKSPKDGRHSLKFLVITGFSIREKYLDELIEKYEGTLDITLQVVDPDGPYLNEMPEHWGGQATNSVQEITKLYKVRKYEGTLKVFKYKYLPFMNGEIINEDHLILSLFGWDKQTKKLGHDREYYFYFHRNSKTKKVFELFESWFDHAPKSPWETNV